MAKKLRSLSKSGKVVYSDSAVQVLYPINAGQVRLLKEKKSLDLLLHQLRQFSNGKHDDLIDSFTQALRVLPTLGGGKAVWRIS